MASFPNTTGFQFSYSHVRIVVDNVQYIAVESIDANMPIAEGYVFGTHNKVIGRSAGRQEAGSGTIVFSAISEAHALIKQVSEFDPKGRPHMAIFDMDVTLENEDGEILSYELISLRLMESNFSFSQGPDAIQKSIPFSFLDKRVDGKSLV